MIIVYDAYIAIINNTKKLYTSSLSNIYSAILLIHSNRNNNYYTENKLLKHRQKSCSRRHFQRDTCIKGLFWLPLELCYMSQICSKMACFLISAYFGGHFCYHSNCKSRINAKILHFGYCSNKLIQRNL